MVETGDRLIGDALKSSSVGAFLGPLNQLA
jgi:hypothetical protein